MNIDPLLLTYVTPLVGLWGVLHLRNRRKSHRAMRVMEEAIAAGLGEPASLHPVIDPTKCLGCASCVAACPEKSVLGVIDGRAKLIEPSLCVGHGACRDACPTKAITLVFGTATRGVDIPLVQPNFETNVPGLFIAGELGGMGLIRNAIEQGRQAMDSIAHRTGKLHHDAPLDVLVVGAGPAGISASLGAMHHKLRFKTIEQDSLGGTVAHFPRGKLVMTKPADLPMVGRVKFGEVSKEELLSFWRKVVAETGLKVGFEERVTGIDREGEIFRVTTTKAEYRAASVLLAIGRRGTPRQLGVPGEALPKVVYRMIDPEQYRGQKVLIVGGGDSALEAAASIADESATEVILSYRGTAFSRARQKNRERVDAAVAAGRIVQLLGSEVEEIATDRIRLRDASGSRDYPNDTVIVCAGGVLPTQFLKDAGVEVETKFGTV